MAKQRHSHEVHNLNFWELTSIQSASQSVPGILIGGTLAQQFGTSAAITSICIGNLILWLIGWGVISISAQERKNAIEIVEKYVGKAGGLLMALILVIAFLSWYMIEISASTAALAPLFQSPEKGQPLLIIGILLGLITACLAIGGIRLIKWTCVIGLPFVFGFMLYVNLISPYKIIETPWNFSFSAILTVAAYSLPGTVNLPTFFRHSISRADSYLALTLLTIFNIFLQLSTVFIGMTAPSQILTNFSTNIGIGFYSAISALFILTTLICLNLVNIYYSSAAVKAILPKLSETKGFFGIGILGTLFYAFFQNSSLIPALENSADNFIANFGIILLISFLISLIVQHRPRAFEKSVSLTCWSIGCAAALTLQILHPQDPNQALVTGFGGTIIAFLFILLLEETLWSMGKIFRT